MRPGQIVRHQTGSQAEGGVVRTAYHFFFAVVSENAHYRPKDLFAHDLHLVTAVGKYRRRHISPFGVFPLSHTFAAAQQASAAFLAAFNEA
ncbi:hypothetical protein D3C71_1924130 [compost metagenome]